MAKRPPPAPPLPTEPSRRQYRGPAKGSEEAKAMMARVRAAQVSKALARAQGQI